ncbi:hypothetical protein DFA_02064 [Cavenderia fasciculata]|uniref:Amino acid transporter transmembrane domain-containing protein n=1 Tax=Cavenderia fasciculata TaxID=261658 RepID=F4PYL1_CACFS|nr:uncharacterized protein DFA_02064 [Cavenderia fasciculata]EGG19277.1 hypothetical protein DFA_02064 [Cavenderia fasciculata]|eukprot:XP_004357548.1 hypothetical protein DFA_02064 [Cavenderia fasciculata]
MSINNSDSHSNSDSNNNNNNGSGDNSYKTSFLRRFVDGHDKEHKGYSTVPKDKRRDSVSSNHAIQFIDDDYSPLIDPSSPSQVLVNKIFDIREKIDDHAAAQNLFGHKTIGYIGGFCLLVGNITGPGLVEIASTYQHGGWILSTLAFIGMMMLSGLASFFLIESMAALPGNPRFQLRVEFVMLCKFYFGKVGYVLAQIFINVSLQATNIASIIICAQMVDSLLIFIFGKSCGVQLYPHQRWTCVETESSSTSPFADYYMLFTLGYLIVLVIIIPLGILNLEDNIIVQTICFILMVAIVTSWIIMFIINGLEPTNLPAIGDKLGISKILGNVIFNYAYITTLPSYVNEVKPTVNIKKSIFSATVFSTFIFMMIGIFGSLAFSNMPYDSDILSMINSTSHANVFSRVSVYIFPFIVLASSIPVFSIIVRYNLTQNRLLKKPVAIFISVILPWIIVIPFMTGEGLINIIDWASLFFSSTSNFIIPLLIYLKSLHFRSKNFLTNEQKEIIDSLAQDTIDWEENEVMLFEDKNQFKGLKGLLPFSISLYPESGFLLECEQTSRGSSTSTYNNARIFTILLLNIIYILCHIDYTSGFLLECEQTLRGSSTSTVRFR